MRCAHCKERDVTISHVRECSGVKVPEPTCAGMGKPTPMWPASDKAIDYAMALQLERLLPDDYQVKDRAEFEAMERDEVSNVINLLKSFSRDPKRVPTGRKQYAMPEGRFAIHHDEKDEWWFFEVNKPTEGRWAGYTFIKRLIGAPGHYRKVDLTPAERQGWLAAIDADPKQAMVNYGLKSEVCGRCSSPLTDADSLARGMGPKCAAKSGWF